MRSLEDILAACGRCGGSGTIQHEPCDSCAAVLEAYEVGVIFGLSDAKAISEWQELMFVKDYKMMEANGAHKCASAIWDVIFKRENTAAKNMSLCASCHFCAHGECENDLPLPGPTGCKEYVKEIE